jgi:multidrug efflux system outer membrane protein
VGRALIVSALVGCLAGCMLGPDYRRPAVDVPQTWRFEDKEARNVANTAWWEQFNDPVLNDLIQTALQENKDVKIAAARIEDFFGQYRTTRAALFPQISGSFGAGQQRVSEVAGPTPQLVSIPRHDPKFDDFQGFLSLGWEIDLWGKLRRASEAARANLLGTEQARRAVILTLVTSVATSYVNLRDLDRQLELTRQTVKSYGDAYDLMKLRFQHGTVSELEVVQTKSQFDQAFSNIPFFEKAIAQQENALSVLLGRNPGPIARGKSINDLALPTVPAGVPSEILENRPDIRQAEQSLIAANANIGVAKALYFPSITLTGAIGTASSDLSKLFTGPALMWSYAGNLAAPIFTAGAVAGQVKSAESVQKENLVLYLQAVQTAFQQVDDALVDQQRTREQLASLAQQVESLRGYVRVARLRYDGGYSSYLEVVFAENLLYAAELTYAQTQGTLFQALVNVYKAMGGGWVTVAERGVTPVPEASAVPRPFP